MTSPPSTKTVLITGAARRIGRAIALDLARAGWQIAIHYRRSKSEAEDLAHTIARSGGTAMAIGGDLSSHEDVESLVPRVSKALGAPACLINNASEFQPDTATNLSEATWNTHLDINLKAPIFLARALATHLPPGTSGNVINIIDQRVWKLTPHFFSYTISKAGLWTATRTLAQTLAPRVRVNAIGPGPVLKSVHQTDADFATEVNSTLLKRGPTTAEVAVAVRFILEAPAMTGQMIALDGGQHLTWTEEEQSPAPSLPSREPK